MNSIHQITHYVMEEYRTLRSKGLFDPESWNGDKFSLPLIEPWPAMYSISVKGYVDYYDEDHHFEVKILDASGNTAAACHSGSGDIYESSLDYTVYRTFLDLCWHQWPDKAVETAWKAFMNVPIDSDDRLSEPFLHVQKEERKDVVLQWFNRTYRQGLPALRAIVEDNAPLHHYKIPVIWQMMAYVDVISKSKVDAFTYLYSPMFGLPEGSYLEDSFMIDESGVEELPME